MSNKKIIKEVFNAKFNSEMMKEKVLNKYKKERYVFNAFKYAFPLCLVFIIFTGVFLSKNDITSNTIDTKMYVYTSLNGEMVELKNNIKLELSTYNMAMSSVPGYPVTFEVNNSDCLDITVTNGNILSWDKDTGIVSDLGNKYQLFENKTLYFSVNKNTYINIKGMKDNNELFEKTVTIFSDDGYNYYAKLNDYEVKLLINSIDNFSNVTRYDANIREISNESVSFLSNINLPNDLDELHSYGIYTKNSKTDSYDILNCYVYDYFNKTDDRNIRIAFSNKNRPLRDYYFGELNGLNSKIKGYDLIIYQFDNSYFVEFKYDGYNYDIETNDITLEELTILLTTIIK